MKRIVLAVLAAIGMAGAVHAQPAPVFNWTGFYVGGSVGHIWAPVDWQYFGVPGDPGYLRSNTRSFTGAVHAGYQWQNGNFIYGLETSFQFPTKTREQCDSPATCALWNSYVQFNNLTTIGPRLGYTFNNGWMSYVTGGYALAQVRSGFYQRLNPAVRADFSDYHGGYFIGAGVEYAYSRSIVIGLEYMHVDLASQLHTLTAAPVIDVSHSVSPSADIVRLRISLRELPR